VRTRKVLIVLCTYSESFRCFDCSNVYFCKNYESQDFDQFINVSEASRSWSLIEVNIRSFLVYSWIGLDTENCTHVELIGVMLGLEQVSMLWRIFHLFS